MHGQARQGTSLISFETSTDGIYFKAAGANKRNLQRGVSVKYNATPARTQRAVSPGIMALKQPPKPGHRTGNIFPSKSHATTARPGCTLEELDGKFFKLSDYPVQDISSWSPDSKNILFVSDPGGAGNLDIYKLNIELAIQDPSAAPIRLTTSGFDEYSPVMQPQP